MYYIHFCVLDRNECTDGARDCDVNAVCDNTQGSYECTCKEKTKINELNEKRLLR